MRGGPAVRCAAGCRARLREDSEMGLINGFIILKRQSGATTGSSVLLRRRPCLEPKRSSWRS
eukprot:6142524-Prymnesium_polylepis.1